MNEVQGWDEDEVRGRALRAGPSKEVVGVREQGKGVVMIQKVDLNDENVRTVSMIVQRSLRSLKGSWVWEGRG